MFEGVVVPIVATFVVADCVANADVSAAAVAAISPILTKKTAEQNLLRFFAFGLLCLAVILCPVSFTFVKKSSSICLGLFLFLAQTMISIPSSFRSRLNLF